MSQSASTVARTTPMIRKLRTNPIKNRLLIEHLVVLNIATIEPKQEVMREMSHSIASDSSFDFGSNCKGLVEASDFTECVATDDRDSH